MARTSTRNTAAGAANPSIWKRLGMGVAFSIIWSSAFIAGKVVVMEMGPATSLFYRFVLTVAVLLPLCGRRLLGPQGQRALLAGALLGLCNNVAYLGLSFAALQKVSPSWVIIVVSCAPFITMALAALRGQEPCTPRRLLGLGAALAGVVGIVGLARLEGGAAQGLTLAFMATTAFAVGAVLFRGKYDDLPLLPVNFWMSVCAMLCFAPAAWRSGITPLALSLPAQAALVWLAVVSLLGMALWLLLIRTQGPATAAAYNMLNPVSGLALAALLLHTPVSPRDMAGAAAIALGLWLAITPPRGK